PTLTGWPFFFPRHPGTEMRVQPSCSTVPCASLLTIVRDPMNALIRSLNHPDVDADELALEMRKATQRMEERGLKAGSESLDQSPSVNVASNTNHFPVSPL